MKMKRHICVLLVLFLMLIFSACAQESASGGGKGQDKPVIVTCAFPEYDWVRRLLDGCSDKAEVVLLLDNGADLHNYQPSAEDVVRIAECDMLVYVGGESEEWVEDILYDQAVRPYRVVKLMRVLYDRLQEVEDGDRKENDEHVWLSLTNAKISCEAIAEGLADLLPDDRRHIESNLEQYVSRLEELDGRYAAAVEQGDTRMLVFADRFPFRYMARDYSLSCHAAFRGCRAETEASFETVIALAGLVDANGLKHIVITETSDGKIAEAVKDATASGDRDIVVLDSMQSKTARDILNGVTYMDTMERNLEALKTALTK